MALSYGCDGMLRLCVLLLAVCSRALLTFFAFWYLQCLQRCHVGPLVWQGAW